MERRERDNTQDGQVMHSTIVHHPQTDVQPIPEQQSAALNLLPAPFNTEHEIL